MTKIDCGSLELALASSAEITNLTTADVVHTLMAVAPDTLKWRDDDVCQRAFQLDEIPVADIVHWYHVSRAWTDFRFDEGILPLAQAEPELWRRLGGLASEWVDADWWRQFQQTIGHEDNYGDHNYIRRRYNVSMGAGPYAFLIREVIAETHYVRASETVADICASFHARTGKDLLAKFSAATEPVIVKFGHPCQDGDGFLDAVNYAHRRVHGLDVDDNRTTNFDGEGVAVARSSILFIERIGNGSR